MLASVCYRSSNPCSTLLTALSKTFSLAALYTLIVQTRIPSAHADRMVHSRASLTNIADQAHLYLNHIPPGISDDVRNKKDKDQRSHEFNADEFRQALSTALLDGISQHLLAVLIALLPSSIFVVRLWRPTSFVSSRLIRVLLSFAALLYFPSLSLWTSIVITILTFLLRQTRDVEILLRRLCDAVTIPVIDSFSDTPPPFLPMLTLSELRSELKDSANEVRRRDALVTKVGRRSPLRALVRVLTSFGIRAGLAALIYVAESRFRDAISVMGPTRPNRLSRSAIIAILRAEMVSAVLLPFKTSVKTYLYGTLVVAAVLVFGPIWMLW